MWRTRDQQNHTLCDLVVSAAHDEGIDWLSVSKSVIQKYSTSKNMSHMQTLSASRSRDNAAAESLIQVSC